MTLSGSKPTSPLHLALAAVIFVSLATPACDQLKKDGSATAEAASEEDDDKSDEKKKKKKKSKKGDESEEEDEGDKKAEKKPEKKTEEPAAKPADGPPVAAPPPAAPPPAAGAADVTKPNVGTFEQPVTTPSQQTYSMASIKTISDDCQSARAILVTAPETVGIDYEWKYSTQAMLANQQFKTVAENPRVRGEVSFEVYQANATMNNGWILVAVCADGLTCNHLAAMYKSIVKSSNPQVFCGNVPSALGPRRKWMNLLEGGAQLHLPAANDTISKCARMAACTIADKTDTTEDVGIACQKAPTSFKLECASRYPCAELLACAK